MSECDNCENYRKVGETWVPYGDTMVKYQDDYECSEGYWPGECGDTDSMEASWGKVRRERDES